MSDDQYRQQCEQYLQLRGWKKDACGWWVSPFGYGIQEALNLAKEASHADALYWNEVDPEYPYEGPRWKKLDYYMKTYEPALTAEQRKDEVR